MFRSTRLRTRGGRLARSWPQLLMLGAAAVVSASIGACRSPLAPDMSLEAHIQQFTGPGALNCGRLGKGASDQEMQAALTCALDATSRAVAFSVVRQYQGTDSLVAEGLVAKAGGSLSKFVFDSAPCGGAGRCSDSFRVSPCNSVQLATQSSGATVFVCAN